MHGGSLGLGIVIVFAGLGRADDTYTLAEKFDAAAVYRIEQKTELSGRITIAKEGKSETIALSGAGTIVFDERVLDSDDPDTQKVVRHYRTFEVRRHVGSREQVAELRPAVRRLVVLRSAKGKSPFSPDGPLLWGEIDAVRTDPFVPALVPALLPAKPVAVNDSWPMAADAIAELTDIEKVTAGGYTLKLAGIVTLNGRRQARISLAGSVRGVDDNGPCRHTLDGTAYFDLADNRLVHLSLKGTHELLDGSGKTSGTIEGRYSLTRTAAADARELSDAALKSVELKPTAENSRLLYDNRDLGVRFLHARRWRVGAVQGRQITLDGPNGAGILLTVETAKTLPTADEFERESLAFLRKSARDVARIEKPRRVANNPALDRFSLAATADDGAIRMEYAVLANADGTGATVAARLPDGDAKELGKDVDHLLKSLAVGKK
jgi:hypothetical protein